MFEITLDNDIPEERLKEAQAWLDEIWAHMLPVASQLTGSMILGYAYNDAFLFGKTPEQVVEDILIDSN